MINKIRKRLIFNLNVTENVENENPLLILDSFSFVIDRKSETLLPKGQSTGEKATKMDASDGIDWTVCWIKTLNCFDMTLDILPSPWFLTCLLIKHLFLNRFKYIQEANNKWFTYRQELQNIKGVCVLRYTYTL